MPTSFINFVKTPWELQRARAMYTIVLWSREYWCPYFCKVKYYIAQDSSTAEKLKVQCALVPDLQLHLSPPLSTQTPALFFIPSFSFSHLLSLPFYTFSILLVSLPLLWGGKILYKNLREKPYMVLWFQRSWVWPAVTVVFMPVAARQGKEICLPHSN